MDDADRLRAYLEGPAARNLKTYATKLGDRLLKLSGAATARADVWREIDVDEETMQLIVTDTIEVRISAVDLDQSDGRPQWSH